MCGAQVYHTNCVMADVVPGLDRMSFFKWPTPTFDTERYPSEPLTVKHTERVVDEAMLKQAASLVPGRDECSRETRQESKTSQSTERGLCLAQP